jgi:hypothetical protein
MLEILEVTMKRAFVVFAIYLAFASVCFAQQNPADAPATKEDIERYLEAMHTRDLMKSMLEVMKKQMHQIAHDRIQKQSGLPSDFDARMDKMMDDMVANFPAEDLLQVMIPVYQKHFTKGDVDALVAFYSSPTGQKFVKELPAIQAEAMQAAMPVIQKMSAKVMDRVDTEIAQAQKAAGADSSKKPQTN